MPPNRLLRRLLRLHTRAFKIGDHVDELQANGESEHGMHGLMQYVTSSSMRANTWTWTWTWTWPDTYRTRTFGSVKLPRFYFINMILPGRVACETGASQAQPPNDG